MTDARRICGYDVRQSGFWPTDESRIEGFLARYGGTLEAAPVGGAAIALQWVAASGQVVTATGLTTANALDNLCRAMRSTEA